MLVEQFQISPVASMNTLTRNFLQVAHQDQVEAGFHILAVATPTQRRAFELLGAPIPLTLTPGQQGFRSSEGT